jgi:hypothetical protein
LCKFKEFFDENDKFVFEKEEINKFSYLVKKATEIKIYTQNEFESEFQKLDKLKIQ